MQTSCKQLFNNRRIVFALEDKVKQDACYAHAECNQPGSF